MNREQVFDRLDERRAAQAQVRFSGGNDSGGADGIVLLDASGGEIAQLHEHVPTLEVGGDGRYIHVPGEGYKTVPLTRQEERDAELAEALTEPVYAEYGGFAGDFDVYGTVTWDAGARTVTISGGEQEYVPFEREV